MARGLIGAHITGALGSFLEVLDQPPANFAQLFVCIVLPLAASVPLSESPMTCCIGWFGKDFHQRTD